MNRSRLVALTAIISLCLTAHGENMANDSIKKQDSGIFLNAESDSKPRQVSLGLPTNTLSAVQIFEDGMPVSYYIYELLPYKSWHGGVSAEKTGSMEPFEASMRYGEINNFVDSYNRSGSDKLRGSVQYTLGTWGQNKIDMNVSGPIQKGWGYSVSAFLNFDPGSNHTLTPSLKDRHQFYKGVLSKRLLNGRGQMKWVYQYVNFLSYRENYGPFIFVGDGSVKEYDGFSLGQDSYRPEMETYTFMDFETGKMRTVDFDDANVDKTHHLTYTLDYDLGKGYHLDVRSRFKTGDYVGGCGSLSGISDVTADAGYTLPDGTPYSGHVQNRTLLRFQSFETSWMNNAELQWRSDDHRLRTGIDYHLNHGGTINSSTIFAHQVKAKPTQLKLKGEYFYNFNTAGEYFDGYENKLAAYIHDEWKIRQHMTLAGFVRMEYLNLHGESANNKEGDLSNTRRPNFNLTLGKITHFSENFLNGAFGIDFRTHLIGSLSLKAQGIYTRVHNTLYSYGGFAEPSTNPTDTKFAQGGFVYSNHWLNLVSQLVYIRQSNYQTRSTFQHALQREVAGYPIGFVETVTLPLTYDIESLGWTTDAMITPGHGFSLHVLFTIRDPKYKNFSFDPTFSDGVTEHYDFSDNNVTALHKMELTLDPSYTWRDWRFWFSARYISKQYINKTNSLFFKERIETFGGVDYTLNQHCKFTVNIINLLNQKGASGQISSADLVEDATAYKNYLMSGTFIRPFTVEFGIKVDL